MAAGSTSIRMKLFFLYFSCCLCFILLFSVEFSDCQSNDNTLAQYQELIDGSTLVSANDRFLLGFYRPRNMNSSFLAVWLYGEMEPVWIANRNSPIPNNISGFLILTIDGNGSLKITTRGGGGDVYSFSLFDVEEATNTTAILLESGNFVLREVDRNGSEKRQLWQSFDHPTDTLLPGMKLGINHKTGFTWSLTSWKSSNSPLSGAFTLGVDPSNTNQLVMLLRGDVFWTSGNWVGGVFEFSKQLSNADDNYFSFKRFSNENETYFTYSTIYQSKSMDMARRLRLDASSNLIWNKNRGTVTPCTFLIGDGNYYSFRPDEACLWNNNMNNTILRCQISQYSFVQTSGFMEGNIGTKYNETESMTHFECRKICLSDCDCAAYTVSYEDGIGCKIWSRGSAILSDSQRKLKITSSRILLKFYRVHQLIGFLSLCAEFNPRRWDASEEFDYTTAIIFGVTGAIVIMLLCFIFYLKWMMHIVKVIRTIIKKSSEEQTLLSELGVRVKSFNFLKRKNRGRGEGKRRSNLQFYSFESIVAATNNFSVENKLGEGGFGPVYKGRLFDGQEVAIKRLSKNSRQGSEEFKNEAMIIAELQHTNLVKLVGCCIYREERLLIYEYLPNKSLDFFLFDQEKKMLLDWNKRFYIIQGIVQGLLYLHNYSRLRIIHRDLKVSNILLDDEMNAKISDFGMARIFESTDCEANTRRVVGTPGYMSPEYLIEGVFSTKSDVYSFGVLLLEIVTGQRNYKNYDVEHPLNLIGYAWELWIDGRGEELIDSTLCNSNHASKALRFIHISLLCVQQIPDDRLTMLDIIFMIYNDTTHLPQPKPPGFYIGRNSQPSKREIYSSNEMSTSEIMTR